MALSPRSRAAVIATVALAFLTVWAFMVPLNPERRRDLATHRVLVQVDLVAARNAVRTALNEALRASGDVTGVQLDRELIERRRRSILPSTTPELERQLVDNGKELELARAAAAAAMAELKRIAAERDDVYNRIRRIEVRWGLEPTPVASDGI